jgi:uncharacterized membrane protein
VVAVGTLMMIVVLAAIALVAWLIVRSVQSRAGGARSARDILNERYARARSARTNTKSG